MYRVNSLGFLPKSREELTPISLFFFNSSLLRSVTRIVKIIRTAIKRVPPLLFNEFERRWRERGSDAILTSPSTPSSLSLSLISLPISPPRLPSKTAPLDSRFVELFVDAKLVEVGSSEAPRENWIELVSNSAGWKQKK